MSRIICIFKDTKGKVRCGLTFSMKLVELYVVQFVEKSHNKGKMVQRSQGLFERSKIENFDVLEV